MHRSFQNLAILMAAMIANLPQAPAPKVRREREGKHVNGRRPAQNAAKLRKSRQKMSKASRRRNRQ